MKKYALVIPITGSINVSCQQAGTTCQAFDLEADGLGVFLFKSPILYVRWLRSEALAALYTSAMKIYSPFCISPAIATRPEYWTPKTTLAGTDVYVDDLSGILKCIEGIDFFQSISVTELAMLEYDEEGERVISSFSLKS